MVVLVMFDYTNVFHRMDWTNSPVLTVLRTHHYLPFMMCVWASKFHNMVFTLLWVAKIFSGGQRELLMFWWILPIKPLCDHAKGEYCLAFTFFQFLSKAQYFLNLFIWIAVKKMVNINREICSLNLALSTFV